MDEKPEFTPEEDVAKSLAGSTEKIFSGNNHGSHEILNCCVGREIDNFYPAPT